MEIKPEVISVPAGKTINLIESTHIHACPDRFRYRKTPYITFRRAGGVMDAIYLIENILVVNPYDKEQIHHLDPKYRKAISLYVEQRPKSLNLDNEDYRFYILSKFEELPHAPQRKGFQKQTYFTLAELRKREIAPMTVNEMVQLNKKENEE